MEKNKSKKISKNKEDFIPLALFQIIKNHWEELEILRKKLTKHLDENYNMKKSCDCYAKSYGDKKPYPSYEAWEDFVSNSIWDDELDAGEFNKDLKKYSIKKK